MFNVNILTIGGIFCNRPIQQKKCGYMVYGCLSTSIATPYNLDSERNAISYLSSMSSVQ